MIIAAYAGCGKSVFAGMNPETAIDLFCMPYKYFLEENGDCGEKGKANPDNVMRSEYPDNYISAIKDAMSNYKYVLIPSDFWVLRLLENERIPYTLVYPRRDSK